MTSWPWRGRLAPRRSTSSANRLGGTVALALAIAHGDALESLTVCSAAHRGGSIQRAGGWRAYVAEHGMEAWSRMMMDLRFHDDGVPAPVAEWFHREQAATSADSTLDLADLLLGTDLTPMLPNITAPHPDPGAERQPVHLAGDLSRHAPANSAQRAAGLRRRPPRPGVLPRRRLRPDPQRIPRTPGSTG